MAGAPCARTRNRVDSGHGHGLMRVVPELATPRVDGLDGLGRWPPNPDMLLTGRTQQFVHAYIAQWHQLLRKSAPDLATFFEHVRKRVLLDNDPPHIRQGLCLVGMTITHELATAAKNLGEASATNHEAMHELYTQIAEGPEVEIQASDESGHTIELKFQDGARTGYDPPLTEIQTWEVVWRFRVGRAAPYVKGIGKGYNDIASTEGLEWIDLLSRSSADPGAIVGPWTALFERIAWRVLFSHHDPYDLRRAYAAFAHVLLISVESYLDEYGYTGPRPLTPETADVLRNIFGQISDGGSLSCSAFDREGSPIFSADFDHENRTAKFGTEYRGIDPTALVSALLSLKSAHIELPVEPNYPTPKPRSKPRPNEPCSCGSGRKYKKCCGLH